MHLLASFYLYLASNALQSREGMQLVHTRVTPHPALCKPIKGNLCKLTEGFKVGAFTEWHPT